MSLTSGNIGQTPPKFAQLSEPYTHFLDDTDKNIREWILKFFNENVLSQGIDDVVKECGQIVLNGKLSMPSLGRITALEFWASQGKLEFVKKLVEAGARDRVHTEVHKVNNSALYRAATGGHIEVVKYLLEKGAQGNAIFDSFGDHKLSLLLKFVLGLKDLDRTKDEGLLNKRLECLEIILKYLSSSDPKSLQDLLNSENEGDGTLIEIATHMNFQKLHDLLKSYM